MELKPILIGAGLAIVLGVGGTVGYVKHKEFKEAETEVEPDYSLKPYTGELQNETFYIKSGNERLNFLPFPDSLYVLNSGGGI